MKDVNKILTKYGVIVTDNERKSLCEYFLGGGGSKYCSATSQDSCMNCRAYSPVHGEKIHLLSELLTAETATMNRIKKELEAEISELGRAISRKDYTIALLSVGRLFDEF